MRKVMGMFVVSCAMAASAHASTILQFTQLTFGQPFHVQATSATTSTITAVNVPIAVIFDQSFCAVPGCGGVTNGNFFLNLNANSTSIGTNNAGTIVQNFAGTISVTNGGVNLLTVNFSDEFAGSAGASSNIAMGSAQPPDFFTGSSTVLNPAKFGPPQGFALSFSNYSPALALAGSTIGTANMDGTGTFNTTIPSNPVPEPGSMFLMGAGLIGVAMVARRRLK